MKMGNSFNYKKIINDALRNDVSLHSISEMELHLLQNCLYQAAVDLDEGCRKHGIRLFLVGGSLLGAVRHKGFIPWDDDMDLAASREDYEKLKTIFDEEFSDRYELRCPNSKYPNGYRFMQIYKKGTILKHPGKGNPFQLDSVCIDIFPCDYVPGNKIYRKAKGIFSNLLMFVASCVMDRKYGDNMALINKSKNGRVYLLSREIIGAVFSLYKPEKWFGIADKAVQYNQMSDLATLAMGRKHYFGEICPTSTFFPLKEILFNNHMFYAPNDSDSYLRNLYGNDYMTPPSESGRESHFILELKVD